MKKALLFIFSLLFFQTLYAQKEDWNKSFDISKEADALGDEFYKNPDAAKIPAIVAKYEEALSLINKALDNGVECKDAAAYRKSYIYKEIAYLYDEVDNYKEVHEYNDKAFEQWPSFYSLDRNKMSGCLKFESSDPYDIAYTEMINQGVRVYKKNKNYNKVFELLKLYEPVKKGITDYEEWSIYYTGASAYYEEKNNDLAYLKQDYFIRSLEVWPRLEKEDKETNKGLFDFTVKQMGGIYFIGMNEKGMDYEGQGIRAAKALYNVEKYKEADKHFSTYQKLSPHHTLDIGWLYSESAMKEPNKEEAKKAVSIIEEFTSGFSTSEWERLQKVYEFIGNNDKVQEIKNKISEIKRKEEEEQRLKAQREEEERKRREKENRRAGARGRFSLAVGTNPLMYIWKDYPISLDIRIGRIDNEFRVNILNNPKDKYHFGQWNAKGNAKTFPYNYSGMEYSYTLKIIAKNADTKTVRKRKQIMAPYFGFQPRYSHYNFTSEPLTFTDGNYQLQTFQDISISATRYDFCLMGGFLGDNIGGFFHIDYYFGVGVGYRKLDISSTSNDPNFNYASFIFDDTGDRRFDSGRWNKIYMPFRFGFRIGINIL